MKRFIFINDSRKCKPAHDHRKSYREEQHGRRITGNLFTKVEKKTFLTLKETSFLQNFRFERMGIISSPIYHHFNLYGPRHDQHIKGKKKLNRRL